MNGHAKRAEKAIQELGFEYDSAITEQHANGKTYYTHPLAPEEPVMIYGKLDEHASRCVIDRARKIAGLDPVGAKRRSAAVKQRRREQAAKRRERELVEYTSYQKRADQAAVGVAMRRAEREKEARERESAQRRTVLQRDFEKQVDPLGKLPIYERKIRAEKLRRLYLAQQAS